MTGAGSPRNLRRGGKAFDSSETCANERRCGKLGHHAAHMGSLDHRASVVFIHGLNSSSGGTWSRMIDLFRKDAEVSDLNFATYGYPSRLFALPIIGQRFATIQELANGLRTELRLRHDNANHIILVGHSLGGVIARQFLLEQAKQGIDLNRYSIAMYASPHLGSRWAGLQGILAPSQNHLVQLNRNGDLLTTINSDWAVLKIDEKLKSLYVSGSGDRIVSHLSSQPYLGNFRAETLPAYNHSNITQARNHADARFLTLRKFVIDCSPPIQRSPSHGKIVANPLFEVYRPEDEKYYVDRAIDQSIGSALMGNVWLWGPSGVGKTSILRKAALTKSAVIQITLASNRGEPCLSLLRAIATTLSDYVDPGTPPPGGTASAPDLIDLIKRSLSEVGNKGPATVLIEEIPTDSERDRSEFVRYIHDVCLIIRDLGDSARNLRIALSSLLEPRIDGMGVPASARECMQIVAVDFWTASELRLLIDLLADALKPTLTESERVELASGCGGSPRMVKTVFRRWRNGTDKSMSLSELIGSVKAEQV